MSDLRYWVWLSNKPVRSRVKNLLLKRLGGPRDIYFAGAGALERLEFLNDEERGALAVKSLSDADRILGRCEEENISVLTLQDAAYPQRLAEIYDPPAVLYLRGKLPPVDDLCGVAVVGTRNATTYGLKMAQQMGYGLCKCGGMVVSGLTRGVDAEAAYGAVMAGGRCVGVLGAAIDDERAFGRLAYDVTATGAVVSEYPPGAEFRSFHYRERNRITSGLAVATLVVEAPAKSGALLFADEALEQGREVFVVPANADAAHAAGSNRLLMEGAQPALTAWDVLSQFTRRFPTLSEAGRVQAMGGRIQQLCDERVEAEGKPPETVEEAAEKAEKAEKPGSKKAGRGILKKLRGKKDVDKPKAEEYIDLEKQLSGLSEEQLKIITAISEPHTHVDDVIERTGLPAAKVLGELTLLQIKGYVSQEPGKRFSLNIIQK